MHFKGFHLRYLFVCVIFIAYKIHLVEYIGVFYVSISYTTFGMSAFYSILFILVIYKPIVKKDSYVEEKEKRLILLSQKILEIKFKNT